MVLTFSAPVLLAPRVTPFHHHALYQSARERRRVSLLPRAPCCTLAATPGSSRSPVEEQDKARDAIRATSKRRHLLPKIALDAWESAQTVLKLAEAERRAVVTGVLFAALSSLSMLTAPLAFSRVLNSVTSGGNDLRSSSLILLTVYLVGAALKFLEIRLVRSATYRVGASVRTRAFNSLILAEVSALPRAGGVGGALSSLAADASVVESAATEDLARVGTGALEAVVAFICLVALCAPMAALAGIVAPLSLVLGARFGARAAVVARNRSAAQAAASSAASAHLGALDTVKNFGAESAAQAKYAAGVLEARDWGLRAARTAAALAAWNRLLFTLSIVAVLSAGGILVSEGRLSVGAMMAFASYNNALNVALGKVSNALSALVKAAGPAERLTALFALPAEESESEVCEGSVMNGARSVEFRDVSFAYPGSRRLAVAQMKFVIPAGSSAAFVGASGAGKSTIFALLSRFHAPSRGKIVIGGENVDDMSPSMLRGEMLGVVSQDTRMLPGSIRENILLGHMGASDREVEEAARDAGVMAFARELEHGLNESAEGLSGGQRQRVNIARCLLRKAPVVIADEPCAALDAISEKFVNESLERLMRDERTTVMLISHKLESVRTCDRVFVVDGGRIVEEGTHEELAVGNGYYRRLLEASS